jgi:hypothetical protein
MMTINLDNIQITRSKFFNELEGIFPPAAVGKTPCEVVDEDSRFNFKLLRYVKEKDSKRILLINNKMRINSQTIDLRKIRCPLLNILAKYDHIVPLAAGKALKDVYSGKSYEEIVFPSSHIGLSVSKEANLNLWPKVCEWVKRTE